MAAEPDAVLDRRIDALFALPAGEFVAARDALAKQVRAEGDKDAAAEVKALRRPTVAAWAVNQVARTTRTKKDVAALVQVGDRLRDAHQALLAGEGDADIRTATAERRKLVAKLTKAAVELLGPAGEAQRDAISNTFDAAVADPAAGALVRAGRLHKELDAPSAFGAELVFASVTAAPRTARQDASSTREERRAARRARRRDGAGPDAADDAADADADAPDAADDADADADAADDDDATAAATTAEAAPTTTAAERAAARAAAKEAEKRRKQLERELEDRQQQALQAAREAAAARQEVSRLQDLLVTANAKAKAAGDRAERAQWAVVTAQSAVRAATTSE